MLRICSICATEKNLQDFNQSNRCRYPFSYDRDCKVCVAAKKRKEHLKKRFNITEEDYQFLLNRQNGVCALCQFSVLDRLSNSRIGKPFVLCIDHDHTHKPHPITTRGCRDCIRGLLCYYCNAILLPFLEKNPSLQKEIVKQYLCNRPLLGEDAMRKQ